MTVGYKVWKVKKKYTHRPFFATHPPALGDPGGKGFHDNGDGVASIFVWRLALKTFILSAYPGNWALN